jgi:SAM-dependent methyltransferase
MQDKNDQTIQTYQQNFDKYVERTPQDVDGEFKSWIDAFLQELPVNGEVFELGSAFGRDAKYIADKGFKVYCTDIIPQALEKLAQEGFETAEYDFRVAPRAEWKGRFDGFFASAVLLHAPQPVFEQAVWSILEVLKVGGVCAFSLKTGTGDEVSTEKMDAPRFFKYYSLDEVEKILAKYPVIIVSANLTSDGKWMQIIFKKM